MTHPARNGLTWDDDKTPYLLEPPVGFELTTFDPNR